VRAEMMKIYVLECSRDAGSDDYDSEVAGLYSSFEKAKAAGPAGVTWDYHPCGKEYLKELPENVAGALETKKSQEYVWWIYPIELDAPAEVSFS